jgi:RES domain-containing protein
VSYVWRLASNHYSPLTGWGSRRAGGRWNSPGLPVVYASTSIAICLAEALVHLPGPLPRNYHRFKISIPDDAFESFDLTSLKSDWDQDQGYTRSIGDEWLREERSLALYVPCAVLPESLNVLINPLHLRMTEVKLVDQGLFTFDPRLRPSKKKTVSKPGSKK